MQAPLITNEYRCLLRTFAGYARRAGVLEATTVALRTRSERMRDVIAYVATYDHLTDEEIRAASTTELPAISYRYVWLAALGQVSTLQILQNESIESADIEFGLNCLETANRHLPLDVEHRQFHRLEVELLLHLGRLKQARELISHNTYLQNYYHGYLYADTFNPHLTGTSATYNQWLEDFNRPFTNNHLQPVRTQASFPRFEGLVSARRPSIEPIERGPKVSVIITCYRPAPAEILRAVESILQQSWKNLEIIIIDDASPEEFGGLLEQIANLDSRIRFVQLKENGGTYRARNLGLEIATGDFVTGQDSDDWSHPERIAAQVDYLTHESSSFGVVVEAIRLDDRLLRAFPGRLPDSPCEVSLMIPTALARQVGGYLGIRKGADGEFRLRLEHLMAEPVGIIRKPLYLIRLSAESLSRADFKPGWSHPARRAFWNASRFWHRTAESSELTRTLNTPLPIPVPSAFRVEASKRRPHFDVVFVGDWRTYGGTQRAMIDAAKLHTQNDHVVGLMHLESVLNSSKETTRLADEVQYLINGGELIEVIPDEPTTATMVIIRDPVVLEFADSRDVRLTAEHVLIAPLTPPSSQISTDCFYLPRICSTAAEELFGGDVCWASEDQTVTDQISDLDGTLTVHAEPMPIVLDIQTWVNPRSEFLGSTLTVGRHSENFEHAWPADVDVIERAWPSDGTVDVRILGDIRALLRKHQEMSQPLSWLVFHDSEIQPEAFMSTLDFFVYFPHEGSEQQYCREALEACAAGAVVILPESFAAIHGETALYAEPRDVPALIGEFGRKRTTFADQIEKQREALDSLVGNSRYLKFVKALIGCGG